MQLRWPLALACVACTLMQPAHADVLRCGPDLIEQGDNAARVIEKCGEPTSKSTFEEPIWSLGPNGTVYQSGSTQSELWRYNFGPNRFPAVLKVTNGVVQSITFEKSYG
jgi:hypothetical protein